MLDETTCPVCGKELQSQRTREISGTATGGAWAVAHYLAHLVQQNATRATLLGVSHLERPTDVGLGQPRDQL